jgi:hypothetical protein
MALDLEPIKAAHAGRPLWPDGGAMSQERQVDAALPDGWDNRISPARCTCR